LLDFRDRMTSALSSGGLKLLNEDNVVNRLKMKNSLRSAICTYIDTNHLRFIPEGVAEVSQIFLRDPTFYQKEIAVRTTAVTGDKPIAVLLQCISGVTAINSLVAFYDIHGGKREVLFVYFVPDTTRDYI
jgi:hypothetical protein